MFGIYPESYAKIQEILRSYHSIDEVLIYGSRAKGNYREGSDIDLTLKGSADSNDVSNLINDFNDSSLPYLFDISIYDNLTSESLKSHIDRVGKRFYKKDLETKTA